MAQTVKRLSTTRKTRVRSLGREDPLEKETAIHSSTLAWKIPWTEEPGGLQSMGSHRVTGIMGNGRSPSKERQVTTVTLQQRECFPGTQLRLSSTPCHQNLTPLLDSELLQAVAAIADRQAEYGLPGKGSNHLHSPTHCAPGFCLCLQFVSAFLYSALF